MKKTRSVSVAPRLPPTERFHTYRGVPSTQKEEEPQVPAAAQVIGTQIAPPNQLRSVTLTI